MPVCGNCREPFKGWQNINGKLRNLQRRKYCLRCSPFGDHNTQPIHKRKHGKSGDNINCRTCSRVFVYVRGSGHTKDRCNSCTANSRRFALKQKAVEYKGGKCQKCGYDRCLSALHFHHTDPTLKEFSIAGSHCRKWELVKVELDKCELICANCHAEAHEVLSHNG